MGKGEKEENKLNKKPKPVPLSPKLQRIKRSLPLLSFICFCCGIASIAYYPTKMIANNTYMSENALQPGVASPTFSTNDHADAVKLTEDYLSYLRKYNPQTMPLSQYCALWIREQLESIGLDSVYYHPFYVQGANGWEEGINVVGILRARKASSREALVLTTKSIHPDFFGNKKLTYPTSSLGMALSLMKLFKNSNWLSKDIILVVSDGRHDDEGVRVWLEHYHNFVTFNPTTYYFLENPFANLHHNITANYNIFTQNDFVRSGQIRGALSLDFYDEFFSYITICPEGVNGKLPNLDLINTIQRVALYNEKTEPTLFYENDPFVSFLLSFEAMRELSFHYIQLFLFMLRGASGIPSGDHGWFHLYNIDAVTIRLYHISDNGAPQIPLLKVGRIVEGVFRSLSNLLEHFHQSFYYYLLSTTNNYISIGQYMITYAMIIGSPSIFLVSHFIGEEVSHFIIRAVPRTIIYQVAGVVFYFVFRLSPTYVNLMISYVALSLVTIFLASKIDKRINSYLTAGKKELTFAEKQMEARMFTFTSWCPLLMYLGTFSLLNFNFCLLAAIFLGPAIFVFQPLHKSPSKDKLCALILLALSVPVLLALPHLYIPGFVSLDLVIAQLCYLYNRYSIIVVPFLTLFYYPFNLSLFATALNK